ncbi:PAAR domain-containing protein [Sphingomonas sp.]|uniref:PAAR domain-containing protein n=1 Tax=Sphingomonas sp. TaxID=28214 RepID=UPI002DD62636|nr:PAAR domain-containing protein [Sphingomonas sp.]
MNLPAARMTDMHVCPLVNGLVPHVGGPILPACAPTVLTGSLPQARVGDMCTCVGPPDSIAMGSFNVIVSGSMAARMTDPTVHGGMIVLGCFTVLIGTNGGGGGGGGGAGGGMCAIPENAALCAELAQAHDNALLAQHTYGEDPTLPPGYRHVDPNTPEGRAELDRLGLTPEMLTPPASEESNFHARVYRREHPPGYTIAYRGTQMTEMADWQSNAQQGVGMRSDHYDRALAVGGLAAASGEDVSFTGHSLGGGMASAAAVSTGRPATTYNSAGLSQATVGGYDENSAPVEAYYTPRDPLSGVQDNRDGVIAGVIGVAGAINPFLGAGAGGYILGREMGDSPILPQAYGNRRELPETEGFWDRHNPLNIVEPHSMKSVLKAIEQQQRDAGCI